MLLPVGVLAVGSTFIGFLAIPGVWEPFETWLEPVVPPLVQASVGEDWLTSLFAVALRLDRHLPRLAGVQGATRARAPTALSAPRSSTSSGSTSSTTWSSRGRRS